MMTRVLIHGSCISRDVLRLHPDRFETTHYIARQSWISAFSRPVPIPDSLAFKSRFIQRSVEGDFRSDLLPRLKTHAPASDILLIDLATDRRGFVPIGGTAAVLSYSQEVETCGVLDELSTRPRVEFGTDAHFGRFTRSAVKMKKRLQDLDMFSRTLILRAPFVDTATDGTRVGAALQKAGEEWNRLFIPYFDLLAALGFHVTDPLPEEFAVADPEHQWGIASDHYVPGAYSWWADQIDHVVAAHH